MVIFDQFINSLLSPIEVRPASVYKAVVLSGQVRKKGAINHKIGVNDRSDRVHRLISPVMIMNFPLTRQLI